MSVGQTNQPHNLGSSLRSCAHGGCEQDRGSRAEMGTCCDYCCPFAGQCVFGRYRKKSHEGAFGQRIGGCMGLRGSRHLRFAGRARQVRVNDMMRIIAEVERQPEEVTIRC